MLTRARFVIAILAITVAGITAALFFELGGNTFRADEFDSYDECVRAIPTGWVPGSLDHERALAACEATHARR